MRKPETLTMTMRELDRLKVIQAVVDHGLVVWRAAEKLGEIPPTVQPIRGGWA
ncbi:hypothetical protein [Cupriavidus nantongensis]|uniref:hypothetical protein n=1 Tax=Cupriavidus nantongensis TaxID=1796606 RepID=UPI002245F4CC|nr:hypothetical protein [Cupriavidus nantongensis]